MDRSVLEIPNASEYKGYPFYSHVFNFEKNHDVHRDLAWFDRNWRIPFYITAFYVFVVYVFQRYMRNKEPVDVRKFFFCWNVALAAFSICGMCRGLPEISFVVRHYGVEYSMCENKMNSVTGFWATAFVYSKGFELLETTFLLLRKKLSWIHLAHHVITFIVSWLLIVQKPALGRWAACINFTVHAFMYTYFALKAAKIKIPERISFCLTTLQILQFVILGVGAVYVIFIKYAGRNCKNSNLAIFLGIVADIYFIYIFGKYFIRRYFSVNHKNKTL